MEVRGSTQVFFSFPVSDCILGCQLTNPKELEIQSLGSRLTEIHFFTGRSGWTNSLIEQHRKLSWRLNILVEEVQGLEMYTVSLHNLTHIHEDVITMSAPTTTGVLCLSKQLRDIQRDEVTARALKPPLPLLEHNGSF